MSGDSFWEHVPKRSEAKYLQRCHLYFVKEMYNTLHQQNSQIDTNVSQKSAEKQPGIITLPKGVKIHETEVNVENSPKSSGNIGSIDTSTQQQNCLMQGNFLSNEVDKNCEVSTKVPNKKLATAEVLPSYTGSMVNGL